MDHYFITEVLNETITISGSQGAAIIASLSLIPNVFVIYIILTTISLRVLSNIIIGSSCVSCILLSLILILAEIIFRFGRDPMRRFLVSCVFGKSTEVCLMGIFNFHIAGISLQRYYAINYPYKYQRLISQRKSVTLILVIIWIFPVCVVFTILLIHMLESNITCIELSLKLYDSITHNAVVIPLMLFLPPIVALLIYIILVCKTHLIFYKSRHAIAPNIAENIRKNNIRTLRKSIIQIGMISAVAIVAFFPFFVIHICLTSTKNRTLILPGIITYSVSLIYLVFHPIFVTLFTYDIKMEFVKRYGKCYIQKPASSSGLYA